MSRKRQQQPEQQTAVSTCSKCKRANAPGIEYCTLTGIGDRRVLLCADCIAEMVARSPVLPHPPSGPAGMSETQMQRETRKQKALDRLGTDHPVCACCPMDDWRCMELHHLEGQRYGKTLVILCRNCHRILTDDQKDDPAPVGEPIHMLERIGRYLLGLANLLIQVAGKLKEFAYYLIEQARLQLIGPASCNLNQPP